MPSLTRRSALVGRSAAIDVKGVWIEERDLGKALVLCHRSRAAKAAAAVEAACGWTLPLVPGAVDVQPKGRALWLEPGAWLLVGDPGETETAVATLEGRTDDDVHILATSLSSGRGVIGLSGGGARALIETGCPIDLHPRAFGPGRCAASLFNETPVIIDQISDAPDYALIADRAALASLWDQLLDAARWLS